MKITGFTISNILGLVLLILSLSFLWVDEWDRAIFFLIGANFMIDDDNPPIIKLGGQDA